ncbi:MAG: hypothetical protein DRP60_16095 [Spirochaetes bacterium]|nr:MAG: hypothetical protein DRP60_16095 [Spirochaetota bacterium]
MAKKRRPLLFPSIFLFVLSASFLFAVWRINGLPLNKIFASRKVSASWSILEEIRSLNELETAAYDMKVVFPFDFTGGDEVNWTFLKFQYDRDPSLFSGGLLPEEWKYGELYGLCRQVGIDPGRPDYRFVVMTVSIRAGVDIDRWLDSFSSGVPSEDVGGITVIRDENGGKTLKIKAAPVSVTSFIIEDRDGSSDGFPDVPLTPEGWRLLTEGLRPGLREMALDGGLLETAAEVSELFLKEIFTAAGYDNVEFMD